MDAMVTSISGSATENTVLSFERVTGYLLKMRDWLGNTAVRKGKFK